jgi:radical SAM superfamily enzyme YgiQ (UPF0313 family)
MKIALTRPNYHTHLITPPLGIGYLSSYLKKNGYETKIIDGLNLSLSNDEIVEKVSDCDIVGITVLTAYYLEAKDLTEKLKKAGKIVVWGGAHASILPKNILAETSADFVVVGEGEKTFLELVGAIREKNATNNIAGVYSRETINFLPRPLISNLDELPFPDWEQMDPRLYQKAPHGALIKNFPVAPITTTRGCPYECAFCASPKIWQRIFRMRSPKNVLDEIEYLVKNFGVREIHFEDDNFTLVREHAEAVCKGIIERNLKISWATPNGIRADKVDKELLELMKKSGCYFVVFGIESGNQYILDNIKKSESLNSIENAIKIAHEVGLMTQGFFIFGLPGETKESIQNSINFAKKTKLDRAQFLLLDLIPGSELWDCHHNEIEYDYTKRSYQDTTWIPSTISRSDLLEAQPMAFKKFFFRPQPIWSLIKHFKFSQLSFVLKRLKDFRIFSNN